MEKSRDGFQKIVIVGQDGLNNKQTTPVLSVVDVLLSIFIVTPLVVFSWRGSWGFMDLHSDQFPIWPCFVTGMLIHVVLAIIQDNLHTMIVESDKHWTLKLVSHFLRRLYTYVFLTVTILHWRGGWGVIDSTLGLRFTDNFVAKKEGSHWFLMIWAACFVTLIAIKGLRNAIAPPFAICIDKGNYVFRFPTMFRPNSQGNLLFSILDCTFSVTVMGNLVVAFWRGLWILTDILLMPDNFVWSTWASLLLGLLLVALVFRLQNLTKILCSNYSGFAKIMIADAYIALSTIATVLYWRGVWGLINIYFLPDNPQFSCIISHLIGFGFLVVLNCSNSMLVRGVYKDGQEPNGECVVFPCHYLQIILQQENGILQSDDGQEKMLNN